MKLCRIISLIVFTAFLVIIIHFFVRIFISDSFVVYGDSMEPAFHQGQEVLVNKTIFGARLYKSLDFSDKKLKSCRMPGKRNIRVGDVVVFNYPYPYSNDTIAFKMNYVYVKRCYGSPGDSVRIKDGYYLLSGNKIGPKDFQSILSSTSDSILRSMGVVITSGESHLWMDYKEFRSIVCACKGR